MTTYGYHSSLEANMAQHQNQKNHPKTFDTFGGFLRVNQVCRGQKKYMSPEPPSRYRPKTIKADLALNTR